MTPRRRDLLRAAAAGGALTALAACARIPTRSPIAVEPLPDGAQPGAPYVRALPPPEDAAPEAVVAGFVQAGVGPANDYAVGREYLTDERRAQWRPSAGVVVYSGSEELLVEPTGPGEVTVTVHAVATLAATGVRTQMVGPTARAFTFTLTQVEEQWRISSCPDGIFLSEAAFETLYEAARLYFLDPRSIHLVPDHRWFPVQRAASAVLEALADGPAPFLMGAVHSAVPRSARLAETSVSTSGDGTAHVIVPEQVDALNAAQRTLALSQIEASLRSLPSLPDVRLVVDGADVTGAADDAPQRPVPGHRPIGAGARGVISLADVSAGEQAQQVVPDLADIAVSSPMIEAGGVLATALSADGSTVLIASTDGSAPLREAASGGAFALPCADGAGYVWTAARSGTGVLLALAGTGAADDVTVDAAWLAGRDVASLRIASDDTRLLVLSSDASGARLDLCAVRRTDDGVPQAITEPTPVRTAITEVRDASWYDEAAVIVLGTDPAHGGQRARIVDFCATRDALPDLRDGTTRITGSVVADAIWATAGDALLRSEGETWMRVDLQARDPSFY